MRHLYIFLCACWFLSGQTAFAQSKTDSLKNLYSSAYFELRDMLEGKIKPDFSRAVFLHENAYMGGTLNYEAFMQAIRFRAEIAKLIAQKKPTQGYKKADSLQVQLQASIFKLLTDTTQVEFGEGTREQRSKGAILPARYAWEDFAGQKNWGVMFVSRLMQTNEGNCHSLPYLYKLIADELQVPAWLSCAPHHLYIQSYSQETGLFNTELSSATFPKDSWLMASGYVGKDAVRNRVYMDTLTLKQSIALCLVDLAQGYQRKFKEANFAITCLQTAQKAYPHGLSAYLAEIPLRTALYQTNKQLFQYNCLEALAKKVCALGYQEIPQAEYVRWLANPYKDRKAPNLEREHSKAEGKFSTNPLPTFEVNTLSRGKYQETNDLTKPRKIGALLYSSKQGKILQFVAPDTIAVPIEVSARFLSVDPLTKGYPELTPYQFASNTPIEAIDLDGLEKWSFHNKMQTQWEAPLLRVINSSLVLKNEFDDVSDTRKTSINIHLTNIDMQKYGHPHKANTTNISLSAIHVRNSQDAINRGESLSGENQQSYNYVLALMKATGLTLEGVERDLNLGIIHYVVAVSDNLQSTEKQYIDAGEFSVDNASLGARVNTIIHEIYAHIKDMLKGRIRTALAQHNDLNGFDDPKAMEKITPAELRRYTDVMRKDGGILPYHTPSSSPAHIFHAEVKNVLRQQGYTPNLQKLPQEPFKNYHLEPREPPKFKSIGGN